jgi:hypothetical protein
LNAILKLPNTVGGLGLTFHPTDEDYKNLPEIFWWAIGLVSQTHNKTYRIRQILQSSWQNHTAYEQIKYLAEFKAHMEDYPNMVGVGYPELVEEFKLDFSDYVRNGNFLREKGIIPFPEFFKLLERPHRFYKLIRGQRIKQFNTLETRKRLALTWHNLLKLKEELKVDYDGPRDLAVIKKAAKIASFDWWIKLNELSAAAFVPTKLGTLTEDDYFNYLCDGTITTRDIPMAQHILYNAPKLTLPVEAFAFRDPQ